MTEQDIFEQALDKTPEGRAAFLEVACDGDATLRRRLEALLRSHGEAQGFLDVPAVEQLAAADAGPATAAADLAFLAPPSEPGSLGRLDHYEVLEVVGRGGMGIVFRARDTKLMRVVALKALATPLAASGTARQRFAREARAAAAVRDDHVVAIHAVCDDAPVPYLVTSSAGAGRWRSRRFCASAARSPAAWRRRTSKGWSTATSSRPTSCWRTGCSASS